MDLDVCLRVKRLGLHQRGKRGGVRLQSHLDVIRPLGSHKDNLLISIGSQISPNILRKRTLAVGVKCSVNQM